MQKYGMYEENGKIRFTRVMTGYSGRRTQRWYTYHVTRRELWRTYVGTKRDWKPVPSCYNPDGFIRSHRLEPVWPKHMTLDKGL